MTQLTHILIRTNSIIDHSLFKATKVMRKSNRETDDAHKENVQFMIFPILDKFVALPGAQGSEFSFVVCYVGQENRR